jgi:Matrixin
MHYYYLPPYNHHCRVIPRSVCYCSQFNHTKSGCQSPDIDQRMRLFLLVFITLLLACVPGFPTSSNLHQLILIRVGDLNHLQIETVSEIAHQWEIATNGMVQFDIKLFENEAPPIDESGLLITSVKNTEPTIARAQVRMRERTGSTTAIITGLYMRSKPNPVIYLVQNNLANISEMRKTLLHELGHSLGLAHNVDPDSVMYQGVDRSSDHITRSDLDALCGLYHCDPSKFTKP